MKLFILAALLGVCAADKIVGGEIASPGQFPYIVHLDGNYMAFCDGSIYNEYWIISAAHCFQRGQGYKATAGDFDLSDTDNSIQNGADGSQARDIDEFIRHPDYNSRTLENDVMMIRLVTPFDLGPTVSEVTLPDSTPLPGTSTDISGWGNTETALGYPDILRYVTLPVISRDICNMPDSYAGEVTSTMLCIGDMNGGKDSCQGDSGGPVTLEKTGILVGIVSWGYGCADPNFPGIYTDVFSFVDWIIDTTVAESS